MGPSRAYSGGKLPFRLEQIWRLVLFCANGREKISTLRFMARPGSERITSIARHGGIAGVTDAAFVDYFCIEPYDHVRGVGVQDSRPCRDVVTATAMELRYESVVEKRHCLCV